MNKVRNPIIIDTDPGCDDALAIMLLVKSEKVDIQAITTVAGNNPLQQVTNNARYILDLIDCSDIPLYSGSEKPLKRDLITANVQGFNGLGGLPVKKQAPLDGQAIDKIVEIVKQHPNQVTILAIGPLTNIATAFQREPSLPSLIKELIIMGGAIAVPGNKSRVAEFNFFVDPESANVVFKSDVKKILLPLDICITIPLYLEDFQKLRRSALYPQIYQMMESYINGILEFEKTKGALMYDPLAAYYILNPQAYKTEEMDVIIETGGELTYGMSVADRRTWGAKKPNTSVITSVNRDSFVNDFLGIIGRK